MYMFPVREGMTPDGEIKDQYPDYYRSDRVIIGFLCVFLTI